MSTVSPVVLVNATDAALGTADFIIATAAGLAR
jgi:hypothetical protein